MNLEKSIIIIQGPTAVGKSALALFLAEKWQTEIISADSRQVYKYLDIATAKPSKEEQQKIKHHLLDIINPNENYSAGNFCDDVEKIVAKLMKSNKIPIIVGGTGFYIKSFLEGLFNAPEIPLEIREKFNELARTKGVKYLYKKLREIDPQSASRVGDNDVNRIIRALEIYEITGKTITQLWAENPSQKRKTKTINILITEERDTLYEKINKRVDTMIEAGLLSEMKKILQLGFKQNDVGMNTVGYRELFPFFEDEKPLSECVELIKKHTRNYAKRQFTWYRKVNFDLTFTLKNINFSNIEKEIFTKMENK